ncbi:DNA primase [Mycoplasma wenyonii str. Massachusetts]|uniref:DNA primase n=1 Tax=Mycoplasma wenyonii (strain Massachusetts) TaxID=1197325 RepID=I6Z609_MYCWM|nr:CHC2 zinc finger domain-containing protein [Mycoplasma wenyonii]AFN65008.1 DNA primase [Mycoplasma wenyonii str. Massachusetts]
MADRSQISIKGVIEHYLKLEKKGRNYWALCPFHEDSRASLSISEEKNIFKCFACGVAGDAVSFIMRKEKANFHNALLQAHKILKLPMENVIDPRISHELQQRNQLLKFNEFVSQFYEKHLHSDSGKQALAYLTQERKLTLELIKKFRIGYAPAGKELLLALERVKKADKEYQFIDNEFLLRTGIFSQERGKKDSVLPLFHDRIVIPVFSLTNELIGFSSRVAPSSKSEIKYMHSKETILFRKAQLLYNMPALEGINSSSDIYLFEGCFDLYSLLLVNPEYKAVALMGRELSADTLALIQKHGIKKIVLLLDTDRAGISASLKIIQQLLKVGITPYSLGIDFQGSKDFSELYCSNPNLTLSDPIYFVDWIKASWKSSINQSSPETELLSLNQVVNALLNSLFLGDPARAFQLQPNLDAQFAISTLNSIFSLYGLVSMSQREQELISAKQKSYLEAINLYVLAQSENSPRRIPYPPKEKGKPTTIISDYSTILALWTALLKCKKIHEMLKRQLKDWQSTSLENYYELFQWILLPEEKLFLTQLQENLSAISKHVFFPKNVQTPEISFEKVWDFFELYYSLIHLLLDKSEEYLKSDNLTSLSIKLDWLKKIENDRESLRDKSSVIFNKLLELEKK